MTPRDDRRKDDVLNLVTKWVVIVCFPTMLTLGYGIGSRLLIKMNDMDKHISKLEQQFKDNQDANLYANKVIQARVDDLEGRFNNHLVDHWRHGK